MMEPLEYCKNCGLLMGGTGWGFPRVTYNESDKQSHKSHTEDIVNRQKTIKND